MTGSGLFDLQWLLSESHSRWLRPDEICHMLQNHHELEISKQPPCSPCSGSVYFFDRRVTRYFRNDGHRWKKRGNGKTINEAHEKLKAGNIPMLNCYHAWGEENPNFQRRCYSLLEPNLMHIVFVHYLHAKKMTLNSSDLPLHMVPFKPESCPEFCASNSTLEQKAQNANAIMTSESSFPLSDCQHEQPFYSVDPTYILSETQPASNGKMANAQSLLISELECQVEVFSFEDSLPCGSPHLFNVNAPSFPGKENFDSTKLLATDKMAVVDYAQAIAFSPDISHDWDGYDLQGTESLCLMSDQNLDYQDSNSLAWDAICTALAFFEEDCRPFPYAELQYLELQDFCSLMEDFVWGLATRRAQRQRRWTKISGVFNLFSVRKDVAFKVRHVPNIT